MATRGKTLTVETALVTEICCNCGVLFAMPDEMRDRLISTKGTFYCPSGHQQSYTGESDAHKARRLAAELAEANRQRELANESANNAWRRHDEERELRRNIEKAKKNADRRAAAAVCPVPGCKRQIQQMARHLASKHPGYVAVHTHSGPS